MMLLLFYLREPETIEQNADTETLIDRPAEYSTRELDGGKYGMIDARGVGRLTIAKNREGYTGFLPFCHNKSQATIHDFDIILDRLKSE